MTDDGNDLKELQWVSADNESKSSVARSTFLNAEYAHLSSGQPSFFDTLARQIDKNKRNPAVVDCRNLVVSWLLFGFREWEGDAAFQKIPEVLRKEIDTEFKERLYKKLNGQDHIKVVFDIIDSCVESDYSLKMRLHGMIILGPNSNREGHWARTSLLIALNKLFQSKDWSNRDAHEGSPLSSYSSVISRNIQAIAKVRQAVIDVFSSHPGSMVNCRLHSKRFSPLMADVLDEVQKNRVHHFLNEHSIDELNEISKKYLEDMSSEKMTQPRRASNKLNSQYDTLVGCIEALLARNDDFSPDKPMREVARALAEFARANDIKLSGMKLPYLAELVRGEKAYPTSALRVNPAAVPSSFEDGLYCELQAALRGPDKGEPDEELGLGLIN